MTKGKNTKCIINGKQLWRVALMLDDGQQVDTLVLARKQPTKRQIRQALIEDFYDEETCDELLRKGYVSITSAWAWEVGL